jgi:hypothetical protein
MSPHVVTRNITNETIGNAGDRFTFAFGRALPVLRLQQEPHHTVRTRLRTPTQRHVARSQPISTMLSSAAFAAGQSCRSSLVAEVICDVARDCVQAS